MKIDNYIIRGGENLNDFALKTASFPSDAERVFNEWHTKLGKDDDELENYFELPVNAQYRLFIRSFCIEKSGNRSICYYVGLIVPKEAYLEAKDYYCLNKGLCNVSFSQIQNAANSSFAPIEIAIDWPIPRTTIGLDFQELSKMKRFGEKEFSSNINEMCFSISTNNIDDWFSRLFIAVNPYRMSRAFHIVISREKPRPAMPDDIPHSPKINKDEPPKVAPTLKPFVPTIPSNEAPKQTPKNPNKLRWVFFPIILFSICITVYHFYNCQDKVPLEQLYKLQEEKDSLEGANKNLSGECERLQKDNLKKDGEIRGLKNDVSKLTGEKKQLEAEIVALEKQLDSLKKQQSNGMLIIR